jgi:phytol kinase
MNWHLELLGAGIIAGTMMALILAAELWRAQSNVPAEWTRKLIHIGGGLTCLFLPFLVKSAWTVVALNIGLIILFAGGARLGLLRSLHGVGRSSRGGEYFPVAIFFLYLIAAGTPWLYVSALLVLTLADAAAALVGPRYGTIRFTIENETKSLEGSAAFLMIAFLAIHLPMLLLSDLPRETCVLASFLVALLLTGLELISLHGADNLFVPLAAVIVLGKLSEKPPGEVAFQAASLLGIAMVLGILSWRTRAFNVGGTAAAIIFAYGIWALGSVNWAVPVLAMFLAFHFAVRFLAWRPGHVPRFKVGILAQAFLPVFAILVIANATGNYRFWFGPFATAGAVVLALATGGYGRRTGWFPAFSVAGRLGIAAAAAGICLLPAWWRLPGVQGLAIAGAAMVILLACLIEAALCRPQPDETVPRPWGARRFLITAGAAAVIALLQHYGWLAVWPADG